MRVDELSLASNKAITAQLFNGRNSVIQRDNRVLPNGSASISGGAVFDIGEDRLGFIATLGYSDKWRTRDTLQQTASSADLSSTDLNFQRVITDNRVVVNGLLVLGYEFGDNKLRLTNLYIRDTLKQTRLGEGTRSGQSATFQQQSTAWFERQLIDSHFVGEFKVTPDLSLDVRGGYANAQREAPNEYTFEYFRSNIPVAEDPFGEQFINRLNNGQQGSATASFSDLNEDLWSAGVDLAYEITPGITASVGYAFSDTKRKSERRSFLVVAPNSLPLGVALLRPDFLLQPDVVNAFDITLVDSDPGNPVFIGKLRNHAGYAQVQAEIAEGINLNAGVRYETAKQSVSPVRVFTNAIASLATTNLARNYWLPAATITLDVADKMQVRFNASKTIARPQFRELIFQPFFDPDSNRSFRGNPNLTDSQLINAEARYEWYFARDQRFSAAVFYKKIDNPIESFSSVADNNIITSFANAPQATLYGVEIETQKYFGLSSISDGVLFSSRRAVVIANYTFTKSRLKVGANDPVSVFSLNSTRATDFFANGAPLTGQSDHLVNLQLGLEDTNGLSQQTILVTYASKRVTSRASSALQPDLIEKPGLRLDFVARQGVRIFGAEAELNFEARNLTQTKYQELQENGTNRVFYNRYNVGTTIELGINLKF